MKLIKLILEIIGWLQIALGTTIGTALIAGAIYLIWPGENSKTIAFIIISAGFIAGAIWASFIWKKHGTIEWLSSIRRIT